MSKPVLRVCLSPSQQEHNPVTGGKVESYHQRLVCNYAHQRLIGVDGIVSIVVPDYTRLNEPDDFLSAVNYSNRWGADIHLASHSNAGGSEGTDTFYCSAEGKKLAAAVQKRVGPVSPGKDGGIHMQTAHWAELYSTHCPAILIEIAFHDNKADAYSIVHHPALYGVAMAEGILDYAGIVEDVHKPATKRIAPKLLHFRKEFLAMSQSEQDWVRRYIPRWDELGR